MGKGVEEDAYLHWFAMSTLLCHTVYLNYAQIVHAFMAWSLGTGITLHYN